MALASTLRFALRILAMRRALHQNPSAVAARQDTRLRDLLRHAVRHSPYYRERFRGLDIAHAPLSAFPTTNKRELMAHFDEVVTDPRLRRAELEAFVDDPANCGQLFRGEFAVSHTSGSQGQPLLLVQDQYCLELLFALQMSRGNVSTPVSVGEALRRLREPVRMAVLYMKEGFYPSVSAFDHMPAGARGLVQLLRVAPTEPDLIERLNEFRPEVLVAYANVLEGLATTGDRLRIRPTLRQIVNNSEELTERARERLNRAFGVPILDTYASGECPFLSNGCPAGPGAHVNADWAVLEVVDEAGRPVPPGTPGEKVLLTNLANFVQPIIRYEIGDRVTMADEPCDCGNRLPRIARIEGRSADAFWVADGHGYRPMMGVVIKHALDHVREVREWQAVQEERNRVRLRLELLPGAGLDRGRVQEMLRRQLRMFDLDGLVDLDLEVVPRLQADVRTGKFRRLVSLVGPPLDALTSDTSSPTPQTVPAH